MTKIKTIAMLGEFPPKTQTGVSLSNQLVLEQLSSRGLEITKFEEYSWKKRALSILLHFLKIYFNVYKHVLSRKTDVFYFDLPMSVFALLKILPALIIVKVLDKQCFVYAHLHRGDFKYFVKRNIIKRGLIRYYFKRIDRLIVLSKEFADDVHSFDGNKTCYVLPNTSEFETQNIALPFNYNRQFTCISNYIFSKGIEDLTECFIKKELNHLKLSVYGSVYDKKFYNQLKQQATSNISLNGALSRSEIRKILSQTDCLVLPSWNEGQPIIILEAMSMGIPVIATKVGDISNMLGEDWPFLVAPKDSKTLLKAITQFHKHSDKEKLGKLLLNRYNKYYSLNRYQQNLFSIFGIDKCKK